MIIFKNYPLLSLVNGYLIDAPQPNNLSYLWNFGSFLAFCLVIQIITGVTLVINYNPSVTETFNSFYHVIRHVNNGWLTRYVQSLNFYYILGQIYTMYIIAIAVAESAIGLGILVAFIRLRVSVAIEFK